MQRSSDILCHIKMSPKIFPIISIQPEHSKLVIVYYHFYPKFLKSKLIESCHKSTYKTVSESPYKFSNYWEYIGKKDSVLWKIIYVYIIYIYMEARSM